MLHKSLWRFVGIMSFEDAYQEAYLKYLELVRKYEFVVDNARWFMALYKKALDNLVTDFANKANRYRRMINFSELQAEDDPVPYVENLHGVDLHHYNLEELLNNAPEEVRSVLALLSNRDQSMLGVLAESWEGRGKRRQDGNEFLCRVLGYDHREVDLVQATKLYLEEVE